MTGTKLAVALLACAALAGCETIPTVVQVPIPVECREPAPARPAMPTESQRPGVSLDLHVKALQAEIGIREAYEGQLLVALNACTEPLKSAP